MTVSTTIAAPSGLRLWWHAIRPKTLTISLVPVGVGTALAWVEAGRVDPVAAAVAALAALLIQAGTNLHNDAGDYLRGGDTAARPGPRRVTAAGWAAPGEVLRAAHVAFGLAALCGLYVVWVGGWPLLLLGACSIAAGWSYTGGPRPIAYTPLGELFVILFFGFGAVMGSYWLNAHALSAAAMVGGAAVGALAAAVLLVNNYRDAENDRRVGRCTLPVVAGAGVSKLAYLTFLAVPFLALPALAALLPAAGGVWLAGLALPACLPLARQFLGEPAGPAFNRLLARTAMLQVLYGALLTAGLLV